MLRVRFPSSGSLCISFILLLAPIAAPLAAIPGVDATIAVGAVWPDGSLDRYANSGPHILGRLAWHVPPTPALSLWVDLDAAFFRTDTQRVRIETTGIPIQVEQTTEETGTNFHLGAQLGSGNRRGFFRPRAAAGIGLYLFRTVVEFEGLNQDEPFASQDIDHETELGWRGVLGADFFVTPRWGIATDFVYDEVWDLKKRTGDFRDESSAHFKSIAVGAVFALEKAE